MGKRSISTKSYQPKSEYDSLDLRGLTLGDYLTAIVAGAVMSALVVVALAVL